MINRDSWTVHYLFQLSICKQQLEGSNFAYALADQARTATRTCQRNNNLLTGICVMGKKDMAFKKQYSFLEK